MSSMFNPPPRHSPPRARHPGAFLIAMTGYASSEDRMAALQADFDENLVEDVDLDTLREWLGYRI